MASIDVSVFSSTMPITIPVFESRYDGRMVRTPLTPQERERGERLGRLLREARGDRSMTDIAARAGISAETLRKIETGRAPTPAFFTVAALAGALGLSMDELAGRCAPVEV
jgi:DNA-binding phage protein